MAGIAKNIKEQRIKAGLSQEELAEKLYVTRQTVSNYENGKSNPDIETLEQLADVFQVDMEQLLYGKRKDINKKAVVQTIILCGAIILLFALAPVLINKEKELINETFMVVGIGYAYYIFFLPLGLLFLGAGITKLIFILVNGKPLKIPKKRYIHWIMVGISVVIFCLLLLYALYFLSMGAESYLGWKTRWFYEFINRYEIFNYIFLQLIILVSVNKNIAVYFFFPIWGIGLFLTGKNKKFK